MTHYLSSPLLYSACIFEWWPVTLEKKTRKEGKKTSTQANVGPDLAHTWADTHKTHIRFHNFFWNGNTSHTPMNLHCTCSRQRRRQEAIVCMCMQFNTGLCSREVQILHWYKTEMKAQQNTDAMFSLKRPAIAFLVVSLQQSTGG